MVILEAQKRGDASDRPSVHGLGSRFKCEYVFTTVKEEEKNVLDKLIYTCDL